MQCVKEKLASDNRTSSLAQKSSQSPDEKNSAVELAKQDLFNATHPHQPATDTSQALPASVYPPVPGPNAFPGTVNPGLMLPNHQQVAPFPFGFHPGMLQPPFPTASVDHQKQLNQNARMLNSSGNTTLPALAKSEPVTVESQPASTQSSSNSPYQNLTSDPVKHLSGAAPGMPSQQLTGSTHESSDSQLNVNTTTSSVSISSSISQKPLQVESGATAPTSLPQEVKKEIPSAVENAFSNVRPPTAADLEDIDEESLQIPKPRPPSPEFDDPEGREVHEENSHLFRVCMLSCFMLSVYIY